MRIFRPTNKWKQAPDNLRAEAMAAIEDWSILQRAKAANDVSEEMIRMHNAWMRELNRKIRNAL